MGVGGSSPLNPTKAHASALFSLRKKPLTADAKPLRILSCGEQIQRDEQAGKAALICTSIIMFHEQIKMKRSARHSDCKYSTE